MVIPYQCLATLGQSSIVCAATGSVIQTWDLASGATLVSSWSHPSLAKQPETAPAADTPQESAQDKDNDEPPSKKRRVASDDAAEAAAPEIQEPKSDQQPAGDSKAQKKTRTSKSKRAPISTPVEKPFVALMTATRSGSHLVAVTGSDKTIWVFEHDGKGTLRQLSKR